jgi:DNA repair exonuclease SbcCD ATPase subunit
MTASAENVQRALGQLDVNNDNHWTADGLPRLETVRLLAGDQNVSREQVTQAAPGFSRAAALGNAHLAPPVAHPTPAAATPVAPATAPVVQESVQAPGLPQHSVQAGPPVVVAQTTDEEIKAMEAELAELNNELAQINRAEAELKKEKSVRQTRADDLIIRIEKARPKDSNQNAITSYLAQMRKNNEARAAQIGRLQKVESELGVRIRDMMPRRAPIDDAMARKNGFGTKRPGT